MIAVFSSTGGNTQVREDPMITQRQMDELKVELNDFKMAFSKLQNESAKQKEDLHRLRECYVKQEMEMQALKQTTSNMMRNSAEHMRTLFVLFLVSVFMGYLVTMKLVKQRQRKLLSVMCVAVAVSLFRAYVHRGKTFFVAVGLLAGFAVAFKRM